MNTKACEALITLLTEVLDDLEHVVNGNAGYIDRDMLDRYRDDAAAYAALAAEPATETKENGS